MNTLKILGMRLPLLPALAALLISLHGASLTLPVFAAYDTPASSSIRPGDRVVLHRDVDVEHGARIYIQYGDVRARSSVYQLDPYCYFYLNRRGDELRQPIALPAGDYPIAAVNNRRDLVQRLPQQYAGTFSSGDGGVQYTLATKINLRSAAHPELNSLVCGIWADPSERRYLSLKEITETLGDLVSIETEDN